MKIKVTLLVAIIVFLNFNKSFGQTYDSLNMTQRSNWFNPNESTATGYGIKYNGIWGWDDGQGNEYAIVGASSGTYFINVTNPAAPVLCDSVPGRRNNCIWREIKTYQNYCYMVSDDSPPNSLQIVDMSYLPDSVHVVYDSNVLFERCHTIFIEGNKLYGGYVRGGSIGQASMAVFSLANPVSPTLIRSLNADFTIPGGTVHDMYVHNDTVFASCGYDGLYIFKLQSNNHFSFINSLTTYIDQGYNHATALTDDGNYLVITDEVPQGLDVKIVDVSNLSNMSVVSNFHSDPNATAHNPFILGNLLYMAYYMDGLQVYDISIPSSPLRVGYYDTYWQNPPGTYPAPGYAGAWGAYPYLPSGNVLVNDMQNGLFVIEPNFATGISNNAANKNFTMYPNPVAKGQQLFIRLRNSVSGASLMMTDLQGRAVYQNKFSGETIQINTAAFRSGFYSLSIITDGGISAQKIIITE